jgi:hypothetical protein
VKATLLLFAQSRSKRQHGARGPIYASAVAATMGLQREIASGLSAQEAMKQYLSLVSDSFRKSKWFPLHQSPNSVTFGNESFHTWQLATAVLLFPVGLFALLGEKRHHWSTPSFSSRTAVA